MNPTKKPSHVETAFSFSPYSRSHLPPHLPLPILRVRNRLFALITLVLVLFSPGYLRAEYQATLHLNVRTYILERLKRHDIVFLGQRHKQPLILKMIADLIPSLHQANVTHLALEIESDQQARLYSYIKTGQGLADIKLHSQIECEEYRGLFTIIRSLDQKNRPLPVAIDLPKKAYDDPLSRDQFMAKELYFLVERNPNAKILAIIGGYHVLKKLDWKSPRFSEKRSIREYLHDKKPYLKMFSLGQIAVAPSDPCDFWKEYHPYDGAVAIDFSREFTGWRLGTMSGIAIKPSEVHELLDGIIVY